MKTVPSQQILKTSLRAEVRLKRAGIAEKQRTRLDKAINEYLLNHAEQARPIVIAAYSAFDGEPDLAPALMQLEEQGTKVALPVIMDEPGRSAIAFRQWTRNSELKINRYGISEPSGTPEVLMTEIDLALIPLVAWDESGARLGMGASFYDRLFQPFGGLPRPARIGVAYQVQKIDRVPMDPWDIRLHGVLSESGWFTFPG